MDTEASGLSIGANNKGFILDSPELPIQPHTGLANPELLQWLESKKVGHNQPGFGDIRALVNTSRLIGANPASMSWVLARVALKSWVSASCCLTLRALQACRAGG
jgi:hypothetical protein